MLSASSDDAASMRAFALFYVLLTGCLYSRATSSCSCIAVPVCYYVDLGTAAVPTIDIYIYIYGYVWVGALIFFAASARVECKSCRARLSVAPTSSIIAVNAGCEHRSTD